MEVATTVITAVLAVVQRCCKAYDEFHSMKEACCSFRSKLLTTETILTEIQRSIDDSCGKEHLESLGTPMTQLRIAVLSGEKVLKRCSVQDKRNRFKAFFFSREYKEALEQSEKDILTTLLWLNVSGIPIQISIREAVDTMTKLLEDRIPERDDDGDNDDDNDDHSEDHVKFFAIKNDIDNGNTQDGERKLREICVIDHLEGIQSLQKEDEIDWNEISENEVISRRKSSSIGSLSEINEAWMPKIGDEHPDAKIPIDEPNKPPTVLPEEYFNRGMQHLASANDGNSTTTTTSSATEALKCFRLAADGGHRDAQYQLGCIYHDGGIVAKNYAMAACWFERAAEKSKADAQYRLGIMYRDGLGVLRDEDKAMDWFEQAAKNDDPHPDAQEGLQKLRSFVEEKRAAKETKRPSFWFKLN